MEGSRQPPPALIGPLADRVRQLDGGRLDPTQLAAQANDWARVADARYHACVELRPAASTRIRVGVKDTLDVAGLPTRLGVRSHRHDPRRSEPLLAGLAGAPVVAKLVTTELGIGLEHGCVNPFFPHLDPGGSSTGCAVAVAAHICDLALGVDTVASVRLPAGACGVVGLRLTHDPRFQAGMFPLSPHLDAPGWTARTAADLAFLWHELDLAGDRPASEGRLPGRFRLGIVEDATGQQLDPAVRLEFDRTCHALAAAGHDLVPVRLGELFDRRGLAYELCAREAWDSYRARRASIGVEIGTTARLALESGSRVTGVRYAQLLEQHARFRRAAAERLAADRVHAWLLPAGDLLPRNIHTEPAPPSTIPDPRETGRSPHVNYAAMASLAGLPAITFPVGISTADGAPVCAQVVGAPWSEHLLVELARTVDELVGPVRFALAAAPQPVRSVAP